jgi:hypothetical protein
MFRWPFQSRSYLPPEEEEWQIETWRWLLDRFGGLAVLSQASLVVPSREFFPPTEATGHDRARYVFEAVKNHAGMADWKCELIAQAERPDFVECDHAAAGTFSFDGRAVAITYDPALLDEPVKLVATLAHELAHYFLAAELPPGGEEMLEPATDLTAAYLGFGVFGANVALNFEQHRDVFSHGWSSSRLGYLNESGWIFALAVFAFLRQDPIEPLQQFLKPHLYAELRKATKYLRREPSPASELISKA